MQKRILFGKEAREKLKKGVNTIADAVSVTLGASGKNVLIGGSYTQDFNIYHLNTRVTKDGVSVAKEIYLDDPAENRGALLLREASEKTMMQCGDGTTTTVVLARAIVNAGLDLIEKGANSVELKNGIDKAVENVIEQLKSTGTPIGNDIEKIRQIATISANNDSEIGDLIAKAFEKIGNDGVIDIEESKKEETSINITNGVRIDKGWLIPDFNTNRSKHECELNDVLILVTDKIISKISQIQKIVEHCNKNNKALLVCCNDMDGEALAMLVINSAKKAIRCCVIKNPGFGSSKTEDIEDMAISVGASLISDLKGISLERMTMSLLGSARKVVVSKDQTVIVEGGKRDNEFDDYVANLQMNKVTAEEDEKERIQKRIARLTGGIAVISVGGATEVEMKERKDRLDDAIRATKSAIEEGFCVGAGTIFSKIESGNNILNEALKSPLKQICANAGVESDEIVEAVINSRENFGYNAKTRAIENLVQSGVIDPVKVLRCSLINAASVAGMILTSEAMIVDVY